MITVFFLKLAKWLLGWLPGIDFSSMPTVDATNDVLNIFAWVNYLLPVDVILALFLLTGLYYGFKLMLHVVLIIKDLMR